MAGWPEARTATIVRIHRSSVPLEMALTWRHCITEIRPWERSHNTFIAKAGETYHIRSHGSEVAILTRDRARVRLGIMKYDTGR
jgi:hypothetical protein